jgi:hypothetical protein
MLGNRRHRTALAFGASFLVTALSAVPALAGDSGVGVLVYGFGSFAKIHGLDVGSSDGSVQLDPLKDKHFELEGGGYLGGGGFKIDGFVEGVRLGVGLSVFGVEGTKLRHDGLDHDFYVTASGGWGANLDLHLGYEFLRGPVRPYLDLVGSFGALSLNVDLMHPEFGRLGRTEYSGWQFGFGPRAGLVIPIGKSGYFDLSGTYGVAGMERFRIAGGIGLWTR